MSDLDYAPPSFYNEDGNHMVFVDFTKADYSIELDIDYQTLSAKTKIIFNCNERGYPLFDLHVPIKDITYVKLNEVCTKCLDQRLPWTQDRAFTCKAVQHEIPAGNEHELIIKHSLKEVNADPPPIFWGKKFVRCTFQMSDIFFDNYDARFLSTYLPSNFEFDHYEMSMIVHISGTQKPHTLITNDGEQKCIKENSWEISYPDFFTTSFPWFDVLPTDSIEKTVGCFKSIDGRQLNILVYKQKADKVGHPLTDFLQKVKDSLDDLEYRYGPFPYQNVTILAMPDGFGGMEHAGATSTDLASIRHELDHCYFARCIAPANGDSGWIDEAIAAWGDFGYPTCTAPPQFPMSKTLVSQSVYSRVTNPGAYSGGVIFLAYLDFLLKDKGGLATFLKEVYIPDRKRKSTNISKFKELLEHHYDECESLDDEFNRFVYGQQRNEINRRQTAQGGQGQGMQGQIGCFRKINRR